MGKVYDSVESLSNSVGPCLKENQPNTSTNDYVKQLVSEILVIFVSVTEDSAAPPPRHLYWTSPCYTQTDPVHDRG